MNATFNCKTCKNTFNKLEEFPNSLCVQCYEKTEAANQIYTGEEIIGLFVKSVKKG